MSTAVKSVITCDLEGRIETFNEGAEQLFGWQAPEVIGKKKEDEEGEAAEGEAEKKK